MSNLSFSVPPCLRGGFCLFVLLFASICPAQEAPPPKPMSASARLTSAKTILIKRSGGSDIPYNVVSGMVEGWGRFTIVRSADEADIVLEVSSPSDSSGGVSISSTTRDDNARSQSSKSTHEISTGPSGPVKIVAYDPKSHFPLWSASELPKGGFKQKAREEGLVAAAEKLASKFHKVVDPGFTE